MDTRRRQGLRIAGGAGMIAALAAIGLVPPSRANAQALGPSAFQARTLAEALKVVGVAAPAASPSVTLQAEEVAENGAQVEIGIRSTLPKTDLMAVMVERNPSPLVAVYRFMDGMETELTMNLKMGETSDVVLVARAEGRWYMARRQIKVTLGGCAG